MILSVAVSTHGEFCPGAVRLQEWLTEKYRARVLLEGDRDDGASRPGRARGQLLVTALCGGQRGFGGCFDIGIDRAIAAVDSL